MSPLLFIPAAAFALAAGLLAIAARLLPASFLAARATPRSAHAGTVRQIGGIGLVAGLVIAPLAATWTGGGSAGPALAAAAFGFFLLGLADDAFDLGPAVKLVFQLAMAALLINALMPVAGLPQGAPAWLFVATIGLAYWANAVNFMDGLDLMIVAGLALPVATVSLLVAATRPDDPVAWAGLALAGGLAGFGIHNRPPARMFLGDSGSLAAGIISGAVILRALGVIHPVAALAPFAWFLADTVTTLLLRAWRGENPLKAHADHAYQVARRSGFSVMRISGTVFAVSAGLSAVAILAQALPATPAIQGGLGAIAFVVSAGTLAYLRWRRAA